MKYIDFPNKRQRHPHYEHRAEKLDIKNNLFSAFRFQCVRRVSTHKKILKSFGRIGMRLNKKQTSIIAPEDLDKVCFILINDYDDIRKKDLGVGPLNDGYLVALKHFRLGFKIFYLYDPLKEDFTEFLTFFLKHTQKELTVYYSGRNCNGGITFFYGFLPRAVIGDIIALNANNKAHVIFLTDCPEDGSVFDINVVKDENSPTKNLISFYVEKKSDPESKECRKNHGICTYYFCKIIDRSPEITPGKMVDQMSTSVKRFNEIFRCDISEHALLNRPLFIIN